MFGVKLIGATQETVTKLVLTCAVVGAITGVRWALVGTVRAATGGHRRHRVLFWTRQGASLAAFALLLIAIVSIWFDDPSRLGTVIGFATAGLAIAAQKAVTAFAGYLVIMRGKTFTIGDRIKMGGVRGDVIALGFLQTRILEMGQPLEVSQQEDPGMWVGARQFTGRVVTVTNDKIFEEAVYNFTREFPFIWEEIHVPVPYRADRAQAERILLDAVQNATRPFLQASEQARERLQKRYGVELDRHDPRVFWRLTDNWLELAVRFVVPDHGIRELKDHISRKILAEFDAAGIEVASATVEISRVAPVPLERHSRR